MWKKTRVNCVMLYRYCLGGKRLLNVVSKQLNRKNTRRGFWKGKVFSDPYSAVLNAVWGMAQECTLFRSRPVGPGELVLEPIWTQVPLAWGGGVEMHTSLPLLAVLIASVRWTAATDRQDRRPSNPHPQMCIQSRLCPWWTKLAHF